jgi:hypothetical protein
MVERHRRERQTLVAAEPGSYVGDALREVLHARRRQNAAHVAELQTVAALASQEADLDSLAAELELDELMASPAAASPAGCGPSPLSGVRRQAGLANFLSSIGIGNKKEGVARKLFDQGYDTEAALLAASVEDIEALHLPKSALILLLKHVEKTKAEAKKADEEVEITLKYQRVSTIIKPRKSHVSLQTLSDAVKKMWEEFEEADFQMLVDDEALSTDIISQLESPVTVTVESLRKGFLNAHLGITDQTARAVLSKAVQPSRSLRPC